MAPTASISTAAMTRPSGSVLLSKIESKACMRQATSMPTRKPTSMAPPPSVGVGRSCTRRSSGFTTAPTRTAMRRTTGMAANVTTVTMASTTA